MSVIAGEEGRGLLRDTYDGGGGTKVKRWIGGGGAIYWAGDASVAGSLTR